MIRISRRICEIFVYSLVTSPVLILTRNQENLIIRDPQQDSDTSSREIPLKELKFKKNCEIGKPSSVSDRELSGEQFIRRGRKYKKKLMRPRRDSVRGSYGKRRTVGEIIAIGGQNYFREFFVSPEYSESGETTPLLTTDFDSCPHDADRAQRLQC